MKFLEIFTFPFKIAKNSSKGVMRIMFGRKAVNSSFMTKNNKSNPKKQKKTHKKTRAIIKRS